MTAVIRLALKNYNLPFLRKMRPIFFPSYMQYLCQRGQKFQVGHLKSRSAILTTVTRIKNGSSGTLFSRKYSTLEIKIINEYLSYDLIFLDKSFQKKIIFIKIKNDFQFSKNDLENENLCNLWWLGRQIWYWRYEK